MATAHKAYGLKLRNDAKEERHEVERLLNVVERMDQKRDRMSCALESRVEEAMDVRVLRASLIVWLLHSNTTNTGTKLCTGDDV